VLKFSCQVLASPTSYGLSGNKGELARLFGKALETLPRGLDDTYNEAMERIEKQNEDDRELAK
jgi:hypothetical protein